MKRRKIAILICIFLVGFSFGAATSYLLTGRSLKAMSLVYVGMGHDYIQQKQYLRAVACFNKAIALDENSFIARVSLPESYALAENYEMALEEYQNAIQFGKEEKWEESQIRRIQNEMENLKKRIRER
jgi:tetratricopeptide (TPR) repeat protein